MNRRIVLFVCTVVFSFLSIRQIQFYYRLCDLETEKQGIIYKNKQLTEENDMLTKSCSDLADAYHDMVREEVKRMNVEECGDTECIEMENE